MAIRFENSFFHGIGPKNDSIKKIFGIFIQKIFHSIESRIFNKIIHSKKKEENCSKFQNEAKIWLRSPPEAPDRPLKWTEIGPTNDP